MAGSLHAEDLLAAPLPSSVLVTGAGGLVGSRTTELLLGAGVRVVGIDCLLRAARACISRVLRSSTTSS